MIISNKSIKEKKAKHTSLNNKNNKKQKE